MSKSYSETRRALLLRLYTQVAEQGTRAALHLAGQEARFRGIVPNMHANRQLSQMDDRKRCEWALGRLIILAEGSAPATDAMADWRLLASQQLARLPELEGAE